MKTLIVFYLLIAPAMAVAQQDGTRLALQTRMTCGSVSLPADTAVLPGTPVRSAHSAVNIGGQVLLGASFGVLFSVPSIYAIGLAMWNDNSVAGEIGLSLFFLSSYSFGTAVGVHAIADDENHGHSLWKTWMYSAIGTGVAVGSAFVLGGIYGPLPAGATALFACPLAGAMAYSLFIADWPGDKGTTAMEPARVRACPAYRAGRIGSPIDFSVNLISVEF